MTPQDIRRLIRSAARPTILAAGAMACACATAPADPEPLRVMTYNIAAGRGDLAAIAEVIRSAGPDIVALQEVDVRWSDRSGFADQAAALGSALGMHVRFGEIYSLPAAGGADLPPREPREFGLAILSRAPIVELTNHVIPRLSTQTDATEPVPMPGFLEAVIDIRGARIRVFNTHLDYRADPRVREMQVAAMLDVIDGNGDGNDASGGGDRAPDGRRDRDSTGEGAVILAGDLNARPDAVELRPLFARFTDAWSGGGGMRGTGVAGTSGGTPAPGGTGGPVEAGATYPAEKPDRRIDYILLSDDFHVVDVHVPASLASDHRPVVADVLVSRTGVGK